MKLLWKLLRQHISIGQFSGFVFANLFGMIIVLAGFQFYKDVMPVFTAEDSFMKADYLMVTKRIGTGTTISGRTSTFSARDISELKSQEFVKKIGQFTTTNYKTSARLGINGQQIMNSELYFESVPDDFVDIDKTEWHYTPGDSIVPIILPRTYINMYNFGFAQSHSLPQISEGLMGLIDIDILARGNGQQQNFRGKVIALSSTLAAVLVPQAFMDWSNEAFAPEEPCTPTRLLMEVTNPADEKIESYLDNQGLEIESEKLDAEKTTFFLRMVVSMVMVIGLIISILSFYILILSIYLLVQKNTEKLQNLLLIGYSTGKVALPYQLLTASLNVVVLIIAVIAVVLIRSYYMPMIQGLYPAIETGSILNAMALGCALFIIVTVLNVLIIRNKIQKI